jgi:soluble lytic murein transglycosylase-like protein
MRPSSIRSAVAAPAGPFSPSSFPAIAARCARCSSLHRPLRTRSQLRVAIVLALLSASSVTHAQPVAASPPAVTSESGPFAQFVSEAALRFGIPTSWIDAVIQVESRGVARAVSPRGAMGLMQIMPDTWSGLRSRYELGTDPFDPHDNILAGAAYLRELHDRYGALGFIAAYNAGAGRYEHHLATGRPLPAETQAYVAALAPLLRDGGAAEGNVLTAVVRSWTGAPLFPARGSETSTIPPPPSEGTAKQHAVAASAADWTGLTPQSEGLFAQLSGGGPKP